MMITMRLMFRIIMSYNNNIAVIIIVTILPERTFYSIASLSTFFVIDAIVRALIIIQKNKPETRTKGQRKTSRPLTLRTSIATTQ